MNKCLECGEKTNNPKFCSRSCAAKFNNKLCPKRKKGIKPPRRCRYCREPFPQTDEYKYRKICDKCKGGNSKNYEYVKRSRRGNKIRLVAEIGDSRCARCSYDTCIDALEFHHKDESKKEFSLSANMNKAYEDLITEAKKCVVLCANCHRELHAGIWDLSSLSGGIPSS